MKYLRQFLIILAVSFAGELLNIVLPFPVPASVYGLVIMLLCLQFKIIKVNQVDKAADFLIEIMPVMFIPAAVGLTEVWGELKPMLVPALAAVLFVTVLVMVVSGLITQSVVERKNR